ncbi:MAG: hypothetical protein M3171_03870 [Actinomycetota bacterium]|nr:hypothetical protein [Actinomycetota bacterium]
MRAKNDHLTNVHRQQVDGASAVVHSSYLMVREHEGIPVVGGSGCYATSLADSGGGCLTWHRITRDMFARATGSPSTSTTSIPNHQHPEPSASRTTSIPNHQQQEASPPCRCTG